MSSEEDSNKLTIKPLGAGQEVGRSCIILKFKGKTIMLDCGIHPGKTGRSSLPFIDDVDPEEIDILLISHFHLDHVGALPWFIAKTKFKGKCYMTSPTKEITRWLISDYIKVSNRETQLFTEHDLEEAMKKVETVNFHQENSYGGVKFTCYHAGHVLGAAMFMIEIAGVKVLYTGDFSRMEDRHLHIAEIPPTRPDVLISESTYGTHVHEKRDEREFRFTNLIYDIINRGGRCLIPVFALGRAQELLLILDEYWSNHPELHEVPIFYASSLAKRCMEVYQNFRYSMNDKIKHRLLGQNNPFNFQHISNLRNLENFNDMGPCVVLASPGMMQSGMSRQLFEMWCSDPRNGTIIAGYCVEGTLAKQILDKPDEITSLDGRVIPLKCTVDAISFSAHTDFEQTLDFVRELRPPHIVLVHGEKNEMLRLKFALDREFEDVQVKSEKCEIYTPRNTQSVDLRFEGEKMAKVVGKLATVQPKDGAIISGLIVKKNFNLQIMHPDDLTNYTDLAICHITQKLHISYTSSEKQLRLHLYDLSGGALDISENSASSAAGLSGDHMDESTSGGCTFRLFDGVVSVTHTPGIKVVLEWKSSPSNDLLADSVVTAVLNAENDPTPLKEIAESVKVTKEHFKECLFESLRDMFGVDGIGVGTQDTINVSVADNIAKIDLKQLKVECPEDEVLQQMVQTAVDNVHLSLAPIIPPRAGLLDPDENESGSRTGQGLHDDRWEDRKFLSPLHS